ncbi:MAG: hypothetical protein OXH00_10750 [Candidatus Poribacteria bacterium]|nr:hypothetical protein [Candidatus Poribacteria bacterium]
MNNIRVDIRLRPIRFGFLVRPDDKKKIIEIFRINTCLWGGIFNPIIPFFNRVPSWWERHGFRFENAKQIINGYLDFFEPDFLVEAEEGLADGFGYDSERVLQLSDILEKSEEERWNKFGLSVHDLYSELYQEEFRFELRHQRNMVHVEPKERAFVGFVAANFGSFPTQEGLGYFEHNYKGVFNPEHKLLDAAVLSELYQSGYSSAVGICCAKLRIDFHDLGDIRLFILDAKKSRDLVDFWNLRAVHEHVLPVPIQWIKELSPFCKKLILDNYHSLRGDAEKIRLSLTSMYSRSIPEDDIEEIHRNYLRVDKKGANTIQTWYPSIWGKKSEKIFRTTRPTLEAEKKNMDVQISRDNPEIRFDTLFPEFANEYGNQYRVANVVRLQDWGYADQITTVFPCDYRNPIFPKFRFRMEPLLPTTEGLVIFPKYRDSSEQWDLVDGTTAFNQWLNGKQASATLSDAGSATQQIIETLGGSAGVSCIAHKGVIELLNEISRRSITKTAHYKEFENKIGNAIGNKNWKKRIFENLVERKVVELGLELKCSKCSKWSWYSITQLDYLLTCSFCLKQFDFPITNPIGGKHARWAYRLMGPFALPDYAGGGYAAALGILFFASIIGRTGGSKVAWSSGQELTLPMGEKVEVDFMLWYQREETLALNYPTEMVFGETKSFGEEAFTPDDVNKMKLLAEAFPGSTLVFATMKDKLSQKEINRIRKLAQWGRRYDKDRKQTRAPVIVLTGTELFAEMSLEESWKEKGGKHKNFIGSGWVRTENLRVFANLTQQLYLGMPSYDSVIMKKMREREAKRKRLTQSKT